MKKFLSFMVMSLVALLPFRADAATSIAPDCGTADENGVITCTIGYSTTEAVETLTVTLTEQGGAEVIAINDATDTDWTVSSKDEVNGVWTVLLASLGVSGEGDLFTFQYQVSGETDCKIVVSLNNETTEITPDPEPENPKTGATLPFVALGVVALIAGGAYIATKNKAKMYRI